MDVPYSIIELFEGQEKIHGDAFRQLRNIAANLRDSGGSLENFKHTCRNLENEYLIKKYPDFVNQPVTKDGIALLTKKGGWRYRALLPNAYVSAKSILTRAFSKGVDLRLGKSAIQKALRLPGTGAKHTFQYYMRKAVDTAPDKGLAQQVWNILISTEVRDVT